MKSSGVCPHKPAPMRRSPCGERGLKLDLKQLTADCLWSLPVRGAWIEIRYTINPYSDAYGVAPRAGSVD